MDDPLTGGFASRLADEEEEAEAQSSADALLREPDIDWTVPPREGDDGASGQLPLLVVAVGPAACALMSQCAASDLVGTITLPELPAPEDALPRRDRARHVSEVRTLRSGDGGGGSLLISAEEAVPAERAAAWVRGVFSSSSSVPSPDRVLVLSSMPAHEYRGPGDPSEDVLLFEASRTAAASAAPQANGGVDSHAAAGHVQQLPSGTLVSGLPAAILTHCQVRGRAGTLLLGVQMGQLPDAGFLRGFAAATARCLSSLGHEAEGAVLREKQTVLCARRELNKRLISDATSAMYT